MKHLVEPIKSKNDLKRIEEHLGKNGMRNRLIFDIGINTGLRISDILNLNIEDVKNKTFVEIIEKKTGKYKRFPLNSKLCSLISQYLTERQSIYTIKGEEKALFIGKKHKRLCRNTVYRFLNKACKELKINGNIGTHTMRKSFGFHFYKKYNDIALLQTILNHSSPSITLRYIGISQEEIDFSYRNFEL